MSNLYSSLKPAKQSHIISKQILFILSFIIPLLLLVTQVTATERVSFKEATYGNLPTSVGQVFTMPSDGKALSYTLLDCAAQNKFTSDGYTLYADEKPRTDTLTICPQNQWQTTKVTFHEFDINQSDLLSVYNGDLKALREYQAPLIGSANGYGASAAFGAWVQASCDPGVNESGCLTFVFTTNGDYNKGTGWVGWATCEEKDVELRVPNIASQVWCGEYFNVLTIGGPTVTSNCGTAINDETLVEVYSNGGVCINTTVSKSQGKTVTQNFAVGVYTIKYTLQSDPTKMVSTVFSVGDPSLVCNDRIHVSMGSDCGTNLTPDMITENHCDPIPGIMHYEIIVKDNFGNVIASGGENGNYPYISKDMVEFCGDKVYTIAIKRVYFANYTPPYCNNGKQTTICEAEVIFEDKTPPAFLAYTPKDIIYNCNIELTEEGLQAFSPHIIDNCVYKTASFKSAIEIASNGNCDRTYLIAWKAEDQCGNVAILERQLEVKRPGLDRIIKAPDVFLSCGEDTTEDINNISKTGTLSLQIGYDKNGIFHVTDTLPLSEDHYVCDYIITTTDQSFPSDCGSKTLRYFQLLDWCKSGGVIPIDTQLIKFVDTLAPKIQCSPHASLAMAEHIRLPAYECAMIPSFIAPTATDKCDPNVRVALFTVERKDDYYWTKLGNSLDHSGELECGTYRVGWRAFDQCHEQIKEDTCYRYFIIEDKTSPSAVCKDQLNVSIGTDYAKIKAAHIDGGSTDACGIAQLFTRRTLCGDMSKWDGEDNTYIKEHYSTQLDPTGWKEFVSIECCDIHQMVKLELLVIDQKGNFNICEVDIRPEDKLSPICSYLPAHVSYCDELHTEELGASTDGNTNGLFDYNEWTPLEGILLDYYNESFGDPLTTCTDNLACDNLSTQQEYQLLDFNCGQVQAKRRYRGVDWKGNTSNWVEQTITINYRANWSITFPIDWVGDCGSTIPDTDIDINSGLCDKIAYEAKDQVFQTVEGACFKVIRTFHIINWCKFNPDAPIQEIYRIENNGMVREPQTITSADWGAYSQITYTQILEVQDTEAPIITVGEVDECIIGEGCDGIKYFTATASDCSIASTNGLVYHWEIFENDYSIGKGTGSTFEWTVQAGPTYKVEWWVGDQCGNSSGAEQTYLFKDCKAPSPYCTSGITITLMETGMVDIWARDFDLGSYDNCVSNENLDFRLHHQLVGNQPSNLEEVLQLSSSVIFDCTHIGTQLVSMYVVDAYGNWDYCTTTAIIQDNQISCDFGQVAGKIYMEDGTAVENTEVLIEGEGVIPVPYMTKANGSYDFAINMGGNYTVRPFKNSHPVNGVSTFDVVLVNKHILGIAPFESPYQHIAADANKSNSITAYDMVILRQLILGIIEEFPNNTSWRFVPANYEFLTNTPLGEPFLEYYHIQDMPSAMTGIDFIAVKIGDVSGNAIANAFALSETRSSGQFKMNFTDQPIQKGDIITVPIYPEHIEGIAGYQFTLAFEQLTLLTLEEGIAKSEHFGMQLTNRGYITTSWNSLPSSSTPSQNSNGDPLFQLTFEAKKEGSLKDFLHVNSAITTAEAYTDDGTLLDIQLSAIEPITNFTLDQNTPNPFITQTTINFRIPETSTVQVSILNTQGQIMYQQIIHAQKGNNTFQLHQSLPPGTYFYQLSSPFGTLTKRMIVLK